MFPVTCSFPQCNGTDLCSHYPHHATGPALSTSYPEYIRRMKDHVRRELPSSNSLTTASSSSSFILTNPPGSAHLPFVFIIQNTRSQKYKLVKTYTSIFTEINQLRHHVKTLATTRQEIAAFHPVPNRIYDQDQTGLLVCVLDFPQIVALK